MSIAAGISSSVNHQDRIKAIRVAQQSFDHGIQLTHDREIAAGADVALCKHLSLLLYKAQSEEMDRERHAAAAAAGGGVVAAMHEVGVAWSVADHAVLLAGGAVIDAGEIESVLSPRALESLFGTRFVPSEHGPVPASRRRNDASARGDG